MIYSGVDSLISSGVDSLVDMFNFLVQMCLDQTCPRVSTKVRENPCQVTSSKLCSLQKQMAKVRRRRGNCLRWPELREGVRKEQAFLVERTVNEASKTKGGTHKLAVLLQKLSKYPAECEAKSFVLPEQQELGLSEKQIADDFASFFGKISMEYVPLDPENLPVRVTNYLRDCDVASHPSLPDHKVNQILLERKVTTSCDDDLPATLLSEFLP